MFGFINRNVGKKLIVFVLNISISMPAVKLNVSSPSLNVFGIMRLGNEINGGQTVVAMLMGHLLKSWGICKKKKKNIIVFCL